MKTRFLTLFLSIVFLLITFVLPIQSLDTTEIRWDQWGVPHITAKNPKQLFYSLGWAQAYNHGNLLLKLYGQSRGRAAEYWGVSYLSSDQYVRTMGIPDRAKQWYTEQNPEMRQNLALFAQGINDYLKKHPQAVDPSLKAVLPITGVDILAHWQNVIHFHFVTNPQQVNTLQTSLSDKGSNAWAIAPSKSTTNNTLLLANPHVPWLDLYRWVEVHLKTPDLQLYGATLVGFPVLAIAFNDHLGWTITVNPIDGVDIYELTLQEKGYQWEGKTKAFNEKIAKIKVNQGNNQYFTVDLPIKSSIQGVIIQEKGDKAYALRVTGLDRSGGIKQLWEMANASNLEKFETALSKLQIPLFNILYADKTGNIAYIYHGLIPQRPENEATTSDILSGNTPKTLWQDYHPYKDLPRLVNPQTGWLQNTNDPPWTSTFPPILNPKDYPAYFAPSNLGSVSSILRTQRSLKMLLNSPKFSLDAIVEQKFTSYLEMADRILAILVPTAKALANPIGVEAAEVLQKWDRSANPDSKGTLLFTLWALTLESSGIFSKPWNPDDPLNTPTGLRDINTALAVLEGVAAQIKLLYGKLDVSWGDVVHLREGKQDVAANGASGRLGSFQVIEIGRTKDEQFKGVGGDSFMMAVEFADTIEAKALTIYGNASQPNSIHKGDQLSLYSQGKMRSVWLSPQEIEQHLEFKEVIKIN